MNNTILQEANRTAEYLLSEGNGHISREQVTVAAGDALPSGTVLGIVTASGIYAPYDTDNEDGTATAVAILYAPLAASANPRPGVVTARLSEVAAARLVGLDAAATADLKTRNIIVR